jgi:ankyrin repeat protein
MYFLSDRFDISKTDISSTDNHFKFLKSLGANIDDYDNFDKNILMYLIESIFINKFDIGLDLLKIIIFRYKTKLKLNDIDKNGNSVLMIAILLSINHPNPIIIEIIRLLIENGIDLLITNNDNQTVFDLALLSDNYDIISLLYIQTEIEGYQSFSVYQIQTPLSKQVIILIGFNC